MAVVPDLIGNKLASDPIPEPPRDGPREIFHLLMQAHRAPTPPGFGDPNPVIMFNAPDGSTWAAALRQISPARS